MKISNLYCDAVICQPIPFDFSEGYGETWETVYPDVTQWSRKRCVEYIENKTYEDPDKGLTLDELRDWCANVMSDNPNDYDPMMNYLYPLPTYRDDPQSAQNAIQKTACVVVTAHGYTYLALAGGGMDLSWDIALAYILLGYLPPLFACDLPEYAGDPPKGKQTKTIIAACRRTCQVVRSQAKRRLETLKNVSDRYYSKRKQGAV